MHRLTWASTTTVGPSETCEFDRTPTSSGSERLGEGLKPTILYFEAAIQ